jgi:hypothetical protein
MNCYGQKVGIPDNFNYAVGVNMTSKDRMINECAAVGRMRIGR